MVDAVAVDSYVHSCPTMGRCRQLIFENAGFVWKPHWVDPETGETHLDGTPYGIAEVNGVHYKCCIQCKKPVNAFVAIDLNKELDRELPTVDDILDSVSKLLEGL